MVAARSGLTWDQARLGFDGYQTFKSGIKVVSNGVSIPTIVVTPVKEPKTTVYAQLLGYIRGLELNLKGK